MVENSWWDNFSSGVSDFFSVDDTVSPSSNMKADDVFKTKSALNAVGSYEVPDFGITEIPDTNMIDGLKKFQANNGLKVDGVMKPGGPTENVLGQTLASQGVSTADLLETSKVHDAPLSEPTISKPPQTSWSASAPLGQPPKPKSAKIPKIDPTTGLTDPLPSAPKGKMPTKKQWAEVAKMQQQKIKTAIVPEGETVQQRIQSMMTDKRYGDQNDTRLRDHIQQQFKKAYPGKVTHDETGKMVQPVASIQPGGVEPFDPDGELREMEVTYDQNETVMAQGHEKETADQYKTYTVSDNETDQNEQYASDDNEVNSKPSYLKPDSDNVDLEEAYRDLDYDPDGHGDLWNRIFNEHGDKMATARDDALEMTRKVYGANRGDDESDAFRHAYWSYIMADKFGIDNAKAIGDGHEAYPKRNYDQIVDPKRIQNGGEVIYPSKDATLMDLYNNRMGRELFRKYGKSDRSPEEIIREAVKSGQLRTRPFKIRKAK